MAHGSGPFEVSGMPDPTSRTCRSGTYQLTFGRHDDSHWATRSTLRALCTRLFTPVVAVGAMAVRRRPRWTPSPSASSPRPSPWPRPSGHRRARLRLGRAHRRRHPGGRAAGRAPDARRPGAGGDVGADGSRSADRRRPRAWPRVTTSSRPGAEHRWLHRGATESVVTLPEDGVLRPDSMRRLFTRRTAGGRARGAAGAEGTGMAGQSDLGDAAGPGDPACEMSRADSKD